MHKFDSTICFILFATNLMFSNQNHIHFSPNAVCSIYTEAVKNNQPPHIVLDTTITNVASETVKSLTSSLGLPTVSASFGQEGDIRQWRDINDQKRQYLLQVMPPSDIIPEVVRSIIVYMNITNAAILYDESFGKQTHIVLKTLKIIIDISSSNSCRR